MRKFAAAVVMGFAATASAGESDVKVIEHLQDVSVTIKASTGTGSGVVVTRRRGDETHNFIWTAAHVVEDLRSTRKVIDPKTGTERTLVEFKDATIVKEMVADGRKVGSMELLASVIRYSADEDLALLRVRKKNFLATGADFALDKSPSGEPSVPLLNTDLLHVGSLLGQVGSNSLTRGVLSQVGRLVDDRVFDQTSVIAFPGSSGGGVFFQDGRMMGMLVRGAGPGFNLIVPVRRMIRWAKDADVEWAVDPAVQLPSDDDLKKLPIEDVGAVFASSSSKADAKKASVVGRVTFKPLFLQSQEREDE